MPCTNWSAADEREFQSLSERRGRIMTERRAALDRVVAALHPHHSHDDRAKLAEAMISRADDVRDALEPYDSGVRSAPEITPEADRILHSAGFPERGDR